MPQSVLLIRRSELLWCCISLLCFEKQNGYSRSYCLRVPVIELIEAKSSDLHVCHLEAQNCFLFSVRVAEKWCNNSTAIEGQAPGKVVSLLN